MTYPSPRHLGIAVESIIDEAKVTFKLVCPDRTLQLKERTNFIFPVNWPTDE